MNALLIVAGVLVLYELIVRQQMISTLGGTPMMQASGSSTTQSGLPLPSYQIEAPTGGGPSGAESGAVSGVAIGLNFVPVVGPALSAVFSVIAGGLMKASAQRAAQARTENQAVVAGVLGWDKGVAQVVAAYNQGQLTLGEVEQFFMCPQSNDPSIPSGQGVLWKAYWNEVGPQVQPDRNGCKNGTTVQTSVSYCGGKTYGAGCCVAYDNLKNSSVYMLRAAAQAEASPGRAFSATTVTVYSSKYGGVNRPGYTVTFRKPAAAASLLSQIGL